MRKTTFWICVSLSEIRGRGSAAQRWRDPASSRNSASRLAFTAKFVRYMHIPLVYGIRYIGAGAIYQAGFGPLPLNVFKAFPFKRWLARQREV